jgi:methyltransferase-like protein/2-polyprenyl-3-methyl-5-hydroxy-6-metoxy-1,4-benzoquinol methylase
MSDALRTSYDEMPYASKPRYATHPDCLATLATLLGMRPAPPDGCRLLELGCATGGNLLALAEALPGSRFVGIDLSPRQVAEGQALVRELGLGNIELKALSILDVDDAFGEFDYIGCEGVYSWVPEAVREKILAVCRRHLAPQGVAYISYNTYPGWHQRGVVREMLQFHVRRFAGAEQQVREARAFLDLLVRSLPDAENSYGRMLREEVEMLASVADAYLFHEHLEEDNRPVYFHEFAERAAAHGLQYLADAWSHTGALALAPEAGAALQRWAGDHLQREQYYDFLHNRTFRRSLLCHDRVALNRDPAPDKVSAFGMTALARPVSARPDISSTVAEEFRTERGRVVSTNIPLVKTVLLVLYEAWPCPVSFDALCAAVAERRGPEWADADGGPRRLKDVLLQFYLSNLVALHVFLPRFVVEPGERPLASPLARLQSATCSWVTGRLHNVVELSELDRVVLRCLDGTRDRAGIVDALTDAVAAGRAELRQDGRALREAGEVRAALGQVLGPTLRRLALSALLIR